MRTKQKEALSAPFYTGSFAAVMATGIISTVFFLYRYWWISDALLLLAVLFYLALWFRYLSRLIQHPQDMWHDLRDAAVTFGFMTIVAGSNVLAVRFLFAQWIGLAVILGALALVIWAFLFYTIMTALIIGPPSDLAVVNGGWLIAIVAEQSIATFLAAMITVDPHRVETLYLFSAAFWAMGFILYLIFISLILHRLFFRPVTREDLQPPYWINMGATAIAVLASSRLLLIHVQSPIISALHPFLAGGTLMLWAWGTWWIPLLVILGIWKYWRDTKATYHPSQWSIVFPLGMYATATTTMAHIHGFEPLHWIGASFLWIALGAWILVAALGIRTAVQ